VTSCWSHLIIQLFILIIICYIILIILLSWFFSGTIAYHVNVNFLRKNLHNCTCKVSSHENAKTLLPVRCCCAICSVAVDEEFIISAFYLTTLRSWKNRPRFPADTWLLNYSSRFRWSSGKVLAIGPKVCELKPAWRRWIFKGDRNPYHYFLQMAVEAEGPMS
jgi:hypothetical protein